MQTSAIQQRLSAFQQWKDRVAVAVRDLGDWLEAHRQTTAETGRLLAATEDEVRRERCRIGILGPPSPDTTGLFNALLHCDNEFPLLPEAMGGAPCPTEFLWDGARGAAYLRLLSAGSRDDDPGRWEERSLDDLSPAALAAALAERGQTDPIRAAGAERGGLAAPRPGADARVATWRQAVVSLPHPLLQQGLIIVEVPCPAYRSSEQGLAAEGLTKAHVVLLVLAVDEGEVEPALDADLVALVKGLEGPERPILLVALNQTLRPTGDGGEPPSSGDRVGEMRRSVAAALDLDEDAVLPVSAGEGLAAKREADESRLRSSGLAALESRLATAAMQTRHRQLIAAIEVGAGRLLEDNRSQLGRRMKALKTQLEEMEGLRDKTREVIADLLEATRIEQEQYLKGAQQFQRSREQLLDETKACRALLDEQSIGASIERARTALTRSRTTLGLSRAMKDLFDELRATMQSIASDSERLRKLVRVTYQGYCDDFGLEVQAPKVFLPMNYRVEIELLYQEVDSFRRSSTMVTLPRGAVIRRFDEQMVSRARVLFDQLRQAFDGWIRDTLQPLAEEIDARKASAEKRLEKLQRVEQSKETLQERIENLKSGYLTLAKELTALRNMHNALYHDPLRTPEGTARPRLVIRG